MTNTLIFALLIALIAAVSVMADWESPWYYHGLDGPEFTNSTVDNGVEVRAYGSNLWASTNVEGNQLNVALNVGFERLFAYISGANALNTSIPMTTPVLAYVQPGAGPNCNSTFTVSFFVPYEYQTTDGPPKPTSEDVFIESIGPLNVAVSEFDGYAVQTEIIAKTVELEKEVESSSDIQLDTSEDVVDTWWFAGYDPPFRLNNRHNEVWAPVVTKN